MLMNKMLPVTDDGRPHVAGIRRLLRQRLDHDPGSVLTATSAARNFAGREIADQAADLAFTTRRPFDECVRHVISKNRPLLEVWGARLAKKADLDATLPEDDE
jgi:hypothetical protein